MNAQLVLHLPVSQIERTKELFENLGFNFNANFSSDEVACMELATDKFIMFVSNNFFESFFNKKVNTINDSKGSVIALGLQSPEAVDAMLEKVSQLGIKISDEIYQDAHSYQKSFEDWDGNLWKFFHLS